MKPSSMLAPLAPLALVFAAHRGAPWRTVEILLRLAPALPEPALSEPVQSDPNGQLGADAQLVRLTGSSSGSPSGSRSYR
jgi:hypothetical protein